MKGRLFWLSAAMVGGLALSAGACAVTGTSSADQAAVAIGLDYVPPAHIAGAKVRTPEGIETFLAEDLAGQMSRPWKGVPNPDGTLPVMAPGDAVLRFTEQAQGGVPTGYVSGAMAIMRTDTDIRRWADLRDRKVCLAEGGRYVGSIAAQFGAVEKIYKAPADSLLALRTGECDAAVHDSALLTRLLALPEWKKFSARLPIRDRRELMLVPAAGDAATAHAASAAVSRWNDASFIARTLDTMVRDMAFEVYLDQNVPDCH